MYLSAKYMQDENGPLIDVDRTQGLVNMEKTELNRNVFVVVILLKRKKKHLRAVIGKFHFYHCNCAGCQTKIKMIIYIQEEITESTKH